MLNHPLLRRSTRLVSAAQGGAPIATGERSDAVTRLQLGLLATGAELPRSTKEQSASPDGIFGSETVAAVKAFQRTSGLVVDGLVGKKTLAKLDAVLPPMRDKAGCCSNGTSQNSPRAASIKAAFVGARAPASLASPGGISLPSGVRFLTPAQRTIATSVFGSSLDFSRIVLSDATGLGGRAFTAFVGVSFLLPGAGGLGAMGVVVINAGTFTPSRNLLIHELAHAWQSQHSIDPTRFMANSAASQAIAESLSVLGSDTSAYYFKPGKSFGSYAAEQIACQVEKGVPSILTTIRSLPAGVPHPLNELSLSVPRWETSGPGVDSTC